MSNKRKVYVAMSVKGTNEWISASTEIDLPECVRTLSNGSIIRFENVPYTFEVARWEGTGYWANATKLHVVELNSLDRATNGMAAVLNDPEAIMDLFNVLVNNGWKLHEYAGFVNYHGLNK